MWQLAASVQTPHDTSVFGMCYPHTRDCILVGDQKFGWCRQDFALPACDKSVKTLGLFLSADFSISPLSWKDKN
jgi:hypothetical protein